MTSSSSSHLSNVSNITSDFYNRENKDEDITLAVNIITHDEQNMLSDINSIEEFRQKETNRFTYKINRITFKCFIYILYLDQDSFDCVDLDANLYIFDVPLKYEFTKFQDLVLAYKMENFLSMIFYKRNTSAYKVVRTTGETIRSILDEEALKRQVTSLTKSSSSSYTTSKEEDSSEEEALDHLQFME
jgi:hypothetical protein